MTAIVHGVCIAIILGVIGLAVDVAIRGRRTRRREAEARRRARVYAWAAHLEAVKAGDLARRDVTFVDADQWMRDYNRARRAGYLGGDRRTAGRT